MFNHLGIRRLCGCFVASMMLASCSSQCLIYCHDGTEIQVTYVTARNDCQDEAEARIGRNVTAPSDKKERNTKLLELFATCMKKKGWGVTSPKKTKTTKGGPNDNSDLAGNPWAPTPYGATVAAQQAYAYQQQPYTQSYQPYATTQQPYMYQQQPYNYNRGYVAQQPAAAPTQNYYAQPSIAPSSPYSGYSNMTEASEGYYGPENSNRAGVGLGPGF